MPNILQNRHNTLAVRSAYTPSSSEFFLDTDTAKMFVGDGALAGGMQVEAPKIVVSSATTYSVANVDIGKLLVFTGASCAVTVAAAGAVGSGNIPDRSGFQVLNLTSGSVVITPSAGTINGTASLTLSGAVSSAIIWSDGSNYYAIRGSSGTSGTGTVTNVATGAGLTGGPITATGTISFDTIADLRVLANISGGVAVPSANTLTAIIDATIGGVNGDILYRTGGVWTNQRPRYTVAASIGSAVLVTSQVLLVHRFAKAVTIPANFGAYLGQSSQAGGTGNATASTVVNVDKASSGTPNTFSNVGTITFAAGGVVPTFATSGSALVLFAQGDVMRIEGPASADATFAGFYATIVGFET